MNDLWYVEDDIDEILIPMWAPFVHVIYIQSNNKLPLAGISITESRLDIIIIHKIKIGLIYGR